MIYYGKNCKDAELRAENKNGICKDIHNDGSASALQWIGITLTAPLIFYFVSMVAWHLIDWWFCI